MNQVEHAKTVSRMMHRGQSYGDSGDYFTDHVEKVAATLRPLGRKKADKVLNLDVIVAYLHDVVEDTQATLDDLRDLGFDSCVVRAVNALTRRDGESYMAYIERVSENRHARMVKIADLRVNLSTLPAGDSLHDRYQKALAALV